MDDFPSLGRRTWLTWVAVLGLIAWTIALAIYFGDTWNSIDPEDLDEVMVSEFQRWVTAALWVAGAAVAGAVIYFGRTDRSS